MELVGNFAPALDDVGEDHGYQLPLAVLQDQVLPVKFGRGGGKPLRLHTEGEEVDHQLLVVFECFQHLS